MNPPPFWNSVFRDVQAELGGCTARSKTRAFRQEALDEDHQGVSAGARRLRGAVEGARRLRGAVEAGQLERREESRALVRVELDAEPQLPVVGMVEHDLPSLVRLLGRLALGPGSVGNGGGS